MAEIKEVKEVKEQVKKTAKKSTPNLKEGGVSMTPEKKANARKALKAAGLVAAGFVVGLLAGRFINKAKETTTSEVVPFDLNE